MTMNRRDFIKGSFGIVSAVSLGSLPVLSQTANAKKAISKNTSLVVTVGESPSDNVRRTIEALGGIAKFVKPGDRVFLKPNSITTMGPEFAVNTHPEVVKEVTRLCQKAGASKITALAHDDPSSWMANGIGKAMDAFGGTISAANQRDQYVQVNLPLGLIMRETMVIKELIEYDVFINLPVAKHHAGARLTLGMKNYMGLNWDRVIMHRTDLDQTIADLLTVRRPDLTIVDATRILLTNGPGGPGTVREEKTVIAGTDPVAVDAFTATLFKHDPKDVRHIQCAYEMGLGEMFINKMNIQRLS